MLISYVVSLRSGTIRATQRSSGSCLLSYGVSLRSGTIRAARRSSEACLFSYVVLLRSGTTSYSVLAYSVSSPIDLPYYWRIAYVMVLYVILSEAVKHVDLPMGYRYALVLLRIAYFV